MSSTTLAARQTVTSFARDHAWPLAVTTAMSLWSIVLFGVVRESYAEFRLGRFDLGNMVQAVWSTAQGRPLDYTHGSGEQMSRLGAHVDPLLVLLAPVWMVWPSPLALAFAQIAVVSLGAVPIFLLARRHLASERTAGLLAIAYLMYPWLATSAVGAIHPVTFAIPLYLFCVWFLDTGRLVLFAVCAALAMTTGELMGLPIAALGIWLALSRRRRLTGVVITVAGLAWTFIAVYLIVPRYTGESSMYYGFYDEIGGSPQGVARMLFSEPSSVLKASSEPHDVVYVVWLGLPLLGLFVLSPGLAAVGAPQLLANLLSDFRSMSDPRYHSVAAVVPFLMAATVFGIAKLAGHRRTVAASAVLVCSAMLTFVVGPWARAVGQTPLGGREALAADHVAALREAIQLVPEGEPVSSSNSVGAHLSARRYVYSLPVLGRAEWVVVDLDDPWVVSAESPILTSHPERIRSLTTRLEQDSKWRRVFERDRVLVFQRG